MPVLKKTYRPWTAKELQTAAALYRSGLTHAEAGERIGRSKVSVARALSYAGVYRHHRRFLPEYESRLRRLHKRGHSDQEIADALGLRREIVRQWRNRLSLPVNPQTAEKHRRRYRRFLKNQEARSLVDIRWKDQRIARLLAGGEREVAPCD